MYVHSTINRWLTFMLHLQRVLLSCQSFARQSLPTYSCFTLLLIDTNNIIIITTANLVPF